MPLPAEAVAGPIDRRRFVQLLTNRKLFLESLTDPVLVGTTFHIWLPENQRVSQSHQNRWVPADGGLPSL
ncbi:hypothetical protein AB0B15_22135 [Streptomyces sp. NPDC045456]|uniref:hypothetical protein n=1 Tax=Streptomyces sp. NPDC045456 TaxID=3155254 RepID=UPI003408B9EC